MDFSLPGSSVHGIFQARIPQWVAISSSRGSSWPRDQTHVSCIAGRRFNSEPPGKARDLVKLKALFPVFSTHRIGDVHEFLFNEGLESVRQPFSLLWEQSYFWDPNTSQALHCSKPFHTWSLIFITIPQGFMDETIKTERIYSPRPQRYWVRKLWFELKNDWPGGIDPLCFYCFIHKTLWNCYKN